jgi:hypothetical protein
MTPDEITAAAADHEALVELWSAVEDETLLDGPFVPLAFLCPPAWFAYHRAYQEAGLAASAVLAAAVVLNLATLLTSVSIPAGLLSLGLHIAIALWAHGWLYAAVRKRVHAIRERFPADAERLPAIRAASLPSVAHAAVAAVGYYGTFVLLNRVMNAVMG